MNKYLRKAAKLCLSPVYLLNSCVKRTNWYKNVIPEINNYPTNEWYRTHNERNFDVVNVGSSSGVHAFDYSETGLKAFNWALQPQSMEYSFKILKNYFSVLKKNGIVIIPFSPFSSLSVIGKWSESSDDKYYYILDRSLIDNYSRVSRRRRFPLLVQPKQSLKYLFKDVLPKNKVRSYKVCTTSSEFQNDSIKWIENWMKEFNIQNLEAPLSEENKKGTELRKKTVQEMITFCLERNLYPVLVIPPIHPSLANRLTPVFRKTYIYSFIEMINTAKVPFFDYIDTPNIREDCYFSNSYFMSEEGAKKFTRILLKQIYANHISCCNQ